MAVKVLLADDDRVARAVVARWLEQWGYQVTTASDGHAALRVLEQDPEIRLCIVDWMMPGLHGVDVCRALRGRTQEPYVYAILLTAKAEKDDVVAGLEAGADDYMAKPCHRLELEVRVRAGRRVIELQENLIRAREALRREAMRDSLTGLWNRAALLSHLDRELLRVRRNGGSVCAVMVDVDHFKCINDEHGHLAGDRVLRDVARRFESVLRTYDEVGRFGGEEFLMVLADCDAHYGRTVAERMRRELSVRPVRTHTGDLVVSASFGVAATEQSGSFSSEALLRAADTALYRAKNTGRDRVALAMPGDWVMPRSSRDGVASQPA